MSSLNRTRNRSVAINNRGNPPPNLLKESNRALTSNMPPVKQEKRRRLHAPGEGEDDYAAYASTQGRGRARNRIGNLSDEEDEEVDNDDDEEEGEEEEKEEEEQDLKPNGRAPTQKQSLTNSLAVPMRIRAKDGLVL